jgi:hypothetical protein
MLASENYNNIHVLDTQPITDIISKVTTLNIDERNFINQKDNLKLLLQDFFTELKNISYNISNKENLWFLFDSVPHISRILTPLIYFYYQRDRELTDFFIDNTNGLFDSIEDDQSKLNAKQCAFLLIQKKIQAAEKMWVVRDMKTEKVFFIYQKTTYIS